MTIEKKLVDWYFQNKRDLPWRHTNDPYEIWISEVILQQTRVEQAKSYYFAFLKEFPDVSSLSKASEQDVLKMWQGLGYYSRARNLHKSAIFIMNELNGIFPKNYKELLQLKGVGEYTAAAIAAFAYNEKVAVADGNVFRFLSRLYAENTPINSTIGKKLFFGLAGDLLNFEKPMFFNQAIIEFGAIQCTIKSPDCKVCVLNANCLAYSQNKVSDYPVKIMKLKKKNRFFQYLFIVNNGFTYIKKREYKDIWQGLFEFPNIESDKALSFEELRMNKDFLRLLGNSMPEDFYLIKNIVHQLTHQQLNIVFISIGINTPRSKLSLLENGFSEIPVYELSNYPVPKPIESFIMEYHN
jgi:A/G-specific adenine glycosylase